MNYSLAQRCLQPSIVKLPLSNISLNNSEIALLTSCTHSQPITQTLEFEGPICKQVSVHIKYYHLSVLFMVVLLPKDRIQSYLDRQLNTQANAPHSKYTLQLTVARFILIYTCILRLTTQCEIFMGNLLSLMLEF